MPTPIEVADSFELEFRAQFLALIEVVSQAVPAAQLEAWLDAGDIPAIIRAFENAVAASISFTAATNLRSTYSSIVGATMRTAGLSFGFDLVSDLVVDSIMADASRVIVGVGTDTIESIHRILTTGYLEGTGTAAMARIIRGSVGLLPSHADAAGRYAENLLLSGFRPNDVARLTYLYQSRLRNYRARNIARTETIAAAHAGQLKGWLELANRGALQRHRTFMVWDTKEDDRLCPWCAPMDGQTVPLGELFSSTHKGFPDGKPTARGPGSERQRKGPIKPDPRSQPRDHQGRFISLAKRDDRDHLDGRLVPINATVVPHPPLHPQCRCDMHLTFTPSI